MTHVVDYHRDSLHIDSSSQDIGGNENFSLACTERIDDTITITAIQSTCQGHDFMVLRSQASMNLFGGSSSLFVSLAVVRRLSKKRTQYPHEDNGRSDSHEPIEFHEGVIFRLL